MAAALVDNFIQIYRFTHLREYRTRRRSVDSWRLLCWLILLSIVLVFDQYTFLKMISIGLGTFYFCVFLIQCTVLTSFVQENYLPNFNLPPESEEYLTVVCTVDGILHGIDKFGNKAWSTSTGKAMLSAQNYAAHYQNDASLEAVESTHARRSTKRNGYSILPSTDGTLIYHSIEGMRKTSVTARLLVEQTPFVSNEGISFTGKKSSRLMKLDANSGTILFDTMDSKGGRSVPRVVDPNSAPMWVGRIDYSLEAVNTVTGQQEFNFTYSELIPLPYGSQYQYGESLESQQREHEFEVASDVPLGEAEVVELLGARAAAEGGWSPESDQITSSDVARRVRDRAMSVDSPSLVSGSSSGGDNDSGEGSAVSKAASSKAKKRKGGRKRRKNRVTMEKRASVTPKPVSSESLSQLEVLDSATLSLVSTPDGELYFSDLDGTVMEKVSVSLNSPVFSAFKIHRAGRAQSSASDLRSAAVLAAPTSGGEGSFWGVRSLRVEHRVLTYPAAVAETYAQNGLAVAAVQEDVRSSDISRIIVQSPHTQESDHGDSLGPLYVLEVRDLEMPGLGPGSDKLDNSAFIGKLLSDAPHPTKRELRAQAREQLLKETATATVRDGPPVDKEVYRKHMKRSGAAAAVSTVGMGRRTLSPLQRRNKGGQGVLRALYLAEGEDAVLSAGDFAALSDQNEAYNDLDLQDPAPVIREDKGLGQCALRNPSFYFPISWFAGANDTAINTCQPRPTSSRLSVAMNKKNAAAATHRASAVLHETAKANQGGGGAVLQKSGMRGSHVLRPDLYEGALFRTDPEFLSLDAQMHLFRGMLHAPHQQQQQPVRAKGWEQGWDGWRDGAFRTQEFTASPPLNPVIVSAQHPYSWLDAFTMRVFGLVEHLLLNLIAVLIVVALVFVCGVYFLRSSPAFAHVLPVGARFSEQLRFAFFLLVGGMLTRLGLVPVAEPRGSAAGRTVKSSPPASSRRPLAALPAAVTVDGHEHIPQAAVRFPALEEPSTNNPQTLMVSQPLRSARAPTPPPSAALPSEEEEEVGADGKRLLRVGALLVHCDHVLGYGSHGTTVYRGSLDGRPLAVKRILSQFVRSADRYSIATRTIVFPGISKLTWPPRFSYFYFVFSEKFRC